MAKKKSKEKPDQWKQRIDEMVSAVERADEARQHWMLNSPENDWDPTSTETGREALRQFQLACTICCDGDVPLKAQELLFAVRVFSHFLHEYLHDGLHRRPGQGGPSEEFWTKYREMVAKARTVSVYKTKTLEPVYDLLEQKVPHNQIARMYGNPWQRDEATGFMIYDGPLYDVPGRASSEKILQQAEFEKTGDEKLRVVPPDFVKESDRAEAEKRAEQARRSIDAMNETASDDTERRRSEATIEDYLREGQSIKNIIKFKRVDEQEILEVAHQLQLPIFDPDSSLTWADQKHRFYSQQGGTSETEQTKADQAADDDKEPQTTASDAEQMADDQLQTHISELLAADKDGMLSATDIVEQMNEQFGQQLTVQKVSAILQKIQPRKAA